MTTIDCGCGATLDVAAFEPGTEFACGACGEMLKVPDAAAAAVRKGKPKTPGRAPRRPAAAPAARAGSKRTVVLAAGIGGVLLLGAVLAVVLKKKPVPVEAPPPPVALKPKEEPKKALPPEEAEWLEAKSSAQKEAVAERRILESRTSDPAAKDLYRFFVTKGRTDLAKKAARARLDTDGESPWANETVGRVSAKAALEELAAAAKGLDQIPPEGWERLKKRMEEKRTWVEPEEKAQYETDLAAARRQAKTLEDPWYKEALQVVAEIRADPRYVPKFGPIDFITLPPYLVMAQHQKDAYKQATVNVLGNHSKFFRCLTTEFLKVMGEAGLSTPTLAEMGNPVLKAFVFIDRPNFNVWHGDQGRGIEWLEGVRAYYLWGGDQYMMMYDTGASPDLQSEDTCVAFHEATHQLVHYYRRYYLTQKLRAKKPDLKELDLRDMRLHGQAHWFGEGFAEFFGGADRISSVTGEWRLLRPLQMRLRQMQDMVARGDDNQWSLEEVIQMKSGPHLDMTARKKWGDRQLEFVNLYYGQAWALNHYLYFGKDGAYRAKYLQVVHEEMTCNSGSEMFFRIMGAGEGDARKQWLEDMQHEIRDYSRRLWKDMKK